VVSIGYLARKRSSQGWLTFEALIWMAAWVIFYLPWTFAVEYYLLPFAAGCAIYGGFLVTQAIAWLSTPGKRWPILAWCALILSGLWLLPTLSNNASNARIQLAVDATNAEVLTYLAETAPPGSTVLVNIQYSNEYIDQIRLHLNHAHNRPDITVDLFKFQAINPGASDNPETIYVISPSVANQPLLTVRLGLVEETQQHWNKLLQDFLSTEWKTVYANEHTFRLFTVDLPRLACPILPRVEYCSTPAPVLDRREFSYGWKVYALEKP
jgi:hypothetical protein